MIARAVVTAFVTWFLLGLGLFLYHGASYMDANTQYYCEETPLVGELPR